MNAAPSPAPGSAHPEVKVVASTSASATAALAKPAPAKSRPARRQISAQRLEQIRQAADKSNQTGVSYNIWFNKWSGGDRDDHAKHKSETRCDIARDAGYTRGDGNRSTTVCLHFARGCCPAGQDCTFLHRLPSTASGASSSSIADANAGQSQGTDIFGREKHGDYRDDMGGVGSMQRMNRTLYVGKLHEEDEDLRRVSAGGAANLSARGGPAAGPQWRDGGRTVKGGKSVGQARREQGGSSSHRGPFQQSATEKVVRRHFGEWGEIERVRVLHHRGCAFVTYVSEASAQFAKEAMMNQSLDHNEVLNVRWATDDPNPGAIRRDASRMRSEGNKRIAERMGDEERAFLEARRALEAGEAGEGEDAGGEGEVGQGTAKRARVEEGAPPPSAGASESHAATIDEEEMARLVEENRRNWEEMDRQGAAASHPHTGPTSTSTATDTSTSTSSTTPTPTPTPASFLSQDALGGLAFLQGLRKQQQPVAAPAPVAKQAAASQPQAASTSGLGGLAAYGSDSEEDDDE